MTPKVIGQIAANYYTLRGGRLTWSYYPVSTLPAPYDIVWCRFPFHLELGKPGPYPRPALVRNVATLNSHEADVEIVYGTTNLKMGMRLHDFFVTKSSEMDHCGLDKATRFDLDNVLWLPWATEWFEPLPGYSSPVLGTLSEYSIKMLQLTLMQRSRRT